MIFILGGGPGLLRVPFERLKEYRCIAVNNAYRIAPWAEVVWFGDLKWWNWHREELMESGMKIATCCEKTQVRRFQSAIPDMKIYSRNSSRKYGISASPDSVSWNGHSGGSAINLAFHMGASRIVLLGFDMRMVAGKKNWHCDHIEQYNAPFDRHKKAFGPIARDAEAHGIRIENATPNSSIAQFPIVDLEVVLSGL